MCIDEFGPRPSRVGRARTQSTRQISAGGEGARWEVT